jgi:dihydropyrimidinase
MLDLIVTGGRVVNAESEQLLDVWVKDGQIAALVAPGTLEEPEAARRIDASGTYVLPGGIDAHVHYDLAVSDVMRAQSAAAGSRAGAFGGTTTYIDFAFQAGDQDLTDAIEDKLAATTGQGVHTDYALHAIVSGEFPLSMPEQIREAVSGGIASIKVFTTFRGSETIGGLFTDDGRIFSVMSAAARHGATVMAHCEDDCIIDVHTRQLYAEGRQHFWNIAEARPALAEEAAVRRMILLAARASCPLYLVHLSARHSVEAVSDARSRGSMVTSEVLHPQLVFGPELYRQEQGQRYMNYPPNKSNDDRDALWAGCIDGSIQTLSSDDFAIPLAAKVVGDTVDNCTGGSNGVETRMGVFWSEGVAKRNISPRQFVAMTAANPAKIFGLYGRKGVLRPGADADIVIVDPVRHHTYRQEENLHSDCDYSNWDGWETIGTPVTTILRGQVLVDGGSWVGPESTGHYVPAGVPEVV